MSPEVRRALFAEFVDLATLEAQIAASETIVVIDPAHTTVRRPRGL